jgi:hypothetical protein
MVQKFMLIFFFCFSCNGEGDTVVYASTSLVLIKSLLPILILISHLNYVNLHFFQYLIM